MSNSNGGRPPIPFPTPQGIPLVGQPFTLKGYFSTVVIQCNCEGKGTVILVGGSPSACPSCGKGFIIGSVNYRQDQPQAAQIGIGLVRTEQQPEEKPAGSAS